MSKLDGHRALTRQAIREISATCSDHLIAKNLKYASLPSAVVTRDILDIGNGGHWADFGQKHHFMRRFDGQSHFQAFEEGIEWIESNALQAARVLARRTTRYFKKTPQEGVAVKAAIRSCQIKDLQHYQGNESSARKILEGYIIPTLNGPHHADKPNWQTFGNALHALQDSFSVGHVIRATADQSAPGKIEYVKMYAGDDVKDHSHYDKLWKDAKNEKQFSQAGILAINASKDLIVSIFSTAYTSNAPNEITQLYGWNLFKKKWLSASNDLSKERGVAIDLILKHHTGARIGNNNLKTLNYDEEGLANDLVDKLAVNTQQVHEVFKKLEESYSSDSDDVALLYVQKIQLQKNIHIQAAVKKNSALVGLLVKVMQSGWTSSDEEKCIDFLTTP